jgi:hypothetical protein
MRIKKQGSGEWNTLIEYTFKVPRDYNEEEEKRQAKEKHGLENWALIAHLCSKYPYTKKDITPHWQDQY